MAASTTTPYQGILFSFADMLREIENMRRSARKFLTTESYEFIIPEWKRQLESFKDSPPGSKLRWEIPERKPIETEKSEGKYEPSGRKGKDVIGTLCCVWEIEIPPIDKRSPGKNFLLNGLASIQTVIWIQDEDFFEAAVWTLETGAIDSPGCHFHTQITLEDANGKFPKALSVPRLPAFLHTPMDALEFLLSELFQEEWKQHTARENDYQKTWSSCQRSRLTKLFDWQKEQINSSSGSPWTFLKNQKPVKDIFLS
jgi:hypothetical protein